MQNQSNFSVKHRDAYWHCKMHATTPYSLLCWINLVYQFTGTSEYKPTIWVLELNVSLPWLRPRPLLPFNDNHVHLFLCGVSGFFHYLHGLYITYIYSKRITPITSVWMPDHSRMIIIVILIRLTFFGFSAIQEQWKSRWLVFLIAANYSVAYLLKNLTEGPLCARKISEMVIYFMNW